MRQLLFLLCMSFGAFSQDFQMLPDSCTFCTYLYDSGVSAMSTTHYSVQPTQDTLIQGENYIRIYPGGGPISSSIIGVREVGNTVYGYDFSKQEELMLIDFNIDVGDTAFKMYSEGLYYDAVVVSFDSIQLSNGLYHHWKDLKGIGYIDSTGTFTNGWVDNEWDLRWQEKGLCNVSGPRPYGGILYNVPVDDLVINIAYGFPQYCTADPLHGSSRGQVCNTCVIELNNVDVIKPNESEVVRIIDVLGKEVVEESNKTLIYIYSDGSVRKVFRME